MDWLTRIRCAFKEFYHWMSASAEYAPPPAEVIVCRSAYTKAKAEVPNFINIGSVDALRNQVGSFADLCGKRRDTGDCRENAKRGIRVLEGMLRSGEHSAEMYAAVAGALAALDSPRDSHFGAYTLYKLSIDNRIPLAAHNAVAAAMRGLGGEGEDAVPSVASLYPEPSK